MKVGLDPMAAVNVMSQAAMERSKVRNGNIQPSQVSLSGIGDEASRGSVQVNLKVFPDTKWEDTIFELVKDLPAPVDCLVGLAWLRAHNTDLGLHEDAMTIQLQPRATQYTAA
jgi:hypothetical protein